MEAVFVKAASFIMIIALGWLLKCVGILHIEDLPVFSRLVIKITLPAAIIYNFSKISMDVSMLTLVAVGFVCSGLYMGVGYALFLKGTREEKAFGLLNASGYNIGCFTSLLDTGNAMICTGTSYTMAVSVSGKGKKSGAIRMVRQLFSSVPFDCYILMTILTMLQIRLPSFALQFAETVGSANSFLAPVSSLGVPYTSMIDGDVNLASALNSVSIITGIVCLTAAILVF